MTTLRLQVWIEAGAGMDVDVCQEVSYLIMTCSNEGIGLLTAHLTRGVEIPAAFPCVRANLSKEKGTVYIRIENQQERKK